MGCLPNRFIGIGYPTAALLRAGTARSPQLSPAVLLRRERHDGYGVQPGRRLHGRTLEERR